MACPILFGPAAACPTAARIAPHPARIRPGRPRADILKEAAMSAQRRAPRPEDLAGIVILSDAQISPDGSHVAIVRTEIDAATDEYRSSIWVARSGGDACLQLTRGRRDSAPRWSPDGRTLAFLSDRDGANQLYLLPLEGGEPRRVSALPYGAGPAVWARDGGRIAFRAEVDARPEVRDGAAATR